jgi:hypothetical protein
MVWGEKHDEETRELAYQVWAFEAGRKPAQTRAVLLQSYETDVPLRTIHDWVKRYSWAERVDADLAAIAPDIRRQTIAEIILGSLEGARLLRRSVQDGVEREERPDKVQVTAALGLLDRGGFSHIGPGRNMSVDAPSMLPADVDIASLSLEDALTLQATMLERMTSGAKQPT